MTAQVEFDRALRLLQDRQEIHDVLMRYCRGIDRLDEELIRSAYHPDAWDDHGTFKGNAWEFATRVVPGLRAYAATMHTVFNESVELQGDVAFGETYVIAHHRREQDGVVSDFAFGGRYVDRFERRAGEWRIAHRVVVHEWSRIDPVTELWPAVPQFKRGVRGRDDISYQR